MNLTDPILLICAGILLIGVVFFFWAISKLLKSKPPIDSLDMPLTSSELTQEPLASGANDGFGSLSIPDPLPRATSPVETPPPATSAVGNKDVSDRLDSMSQRLTEMQNVLNKQMASASTPQAGAAAGGALGQGFSPETVEKLLKIIGNVIQQVEVLQKSLTSKSSGSSPDVDEVSGSSATPG